MKEIIEILERIAVLPKGEPLRNALSPTPPSSRKQFDEAFYVKLGPTPAFPKG